MEIIVIGILVLLVCHAAGKSSALETAAKSANVNVNLPAPSSVTPFAATGTPSPATAMGASGAFNQYQVQLDTNSPYANPNMHFYAASGAPSALQGVPLPMVAPVAQNGFNAVPARTKALATAVRGAFTTGTLQPIAIKMKQ